MSSLHFNSESHTNRVLCLLMCLSVWNGPIPVLHCHDAIVECGKRYHHLEHHHVAYEHVRQSSPHWHIAFVCELIGESPASGNDHRVNELPRWLAPEKVETEAADVNWLISLKELSCILPRQCLRMSMSMSFRDSQPSFLSTLLSDRPLVSVTGECLI